MVARPVPSLVLVFHDTWKDPLVFVFDGIVFGQASHRGHVRSMMPCLVLKQVFIGRDGKKIHQFF